MTEATGRDVVVDRYRVHGYDLVLEHRPGTAGSAVVLPVQPVPQTVPPAEAPAVDPPVAADRLVVRLAAPREVPGDAPAGTVVALLADEDDDRAFYTFATTPDRLRLRFHGAVDVEADPGLTEATVHVDPRLGDDILSVLLPGTVMAVRLMLDGRLALHASAVARDGAAVAFVGPSGGGKSTLAALGALAGLDLVTDDVLRVDLDGPRAPRVWPGATAARLRPSVRTVARRFGAHGRGHRTADGRYSTPAGRVADGPLPLGALVLPSLDPSLPALRVRAVPPVTAIRRLVAGPRVEGWRAPAELARQFHQLADLAERVPVVEAAVPVDRRHDEQVVPEILDRALAGG